MGCYTWEASSSLRRKGSGIEEDEVRERAWEKRREGKLQLGYKVNKLINEKR